MLNDIIWCENTQFILYKNHGSIYIWFEIHQACIIPFVKQAVRNYKISEIKKVYDKLRLLYFRELMKDHYIILKMLKLIRL